MQQFDNLNIFLNDVVLNYLMLYLTLDLDDDKLQKAEMNFLFKVIINEYLNFKIMLFCTCSSCSEKIKSA